LVEILHNKRLWL